MKDTPDSTFRHGSPVRRTLSFLRSHPILCLFLLTPGIPEYLSGSSPVNAIVLSPFLFIFGFVANAALYLPGALLIREAMIRWRKGWATVLLLGAAYGILEEGVALSTLFNPDAGPVGVFGFYGHWLGVNWVWVAGIIPVHMIFSISLPILLLGLALPETRGKSLLKSGGAIAATFLVLAIDVFALFLVALRGEHFWMGWPILISSLAAISMLVILARRVPACIIHAFSECPRIGPIRSGVLGALFYPSVLITEFSAKGVGIPAGLTTILVVAVQSLYLFLALKLLGRRNNERQLITFSQGLILVIMAFGIISQIRLPLVLAADAIAILFFWKLWRKYGEKRISYPALTDMDSAA